VVRLRKFREYLIKAFKIISILLFLIIFLPFLFILILSSYVLFDVKNINISYKEELLPVPPSREKITIIEKEQTFIYSIMIGL